MTFQEITKEKAAELARQPLADKEGEQGLVFLIQRFSVQDGPGLRTTVFLKGCPLRCKWCQNPESMKATPELMCRDTKCVSLGKCVAACPEGAITLDENKKRTIDRAKCNLCFKCVAACPAKAIVKVGELMTVEQVLDEVERDATFYFRSGGGVTVSGGEPLLQWRFVYKLLEACRQKHFHTALDTCGYAPWPVFEKVLEHVNLVLYDIKHMDPRLHEEATGKSNELILSNLRKIPLHSKAKIWLRIPLIPGYNDSEENLAAVARLGLEVGAEKVSLLGYHKVGVGKYQQMGMPYPLESLEPASREHLEQLQKFVESFGLKVTIGS